MAISDKLLYLAETKELLRDLINSAGGTLTELTPFRDYVAELEEILTPELDIAELLFSNGEGGIWLDPSDLSTMFQDTAMTIPVTADGQIVRRINDKSGNGWYAEGSGGSGPTFRDVDGIRYLEFPNTLLLASSEVAFNNSEDMTVFLGTTKLSDGQLDIILETRNTNNNDGGFLIAGPGSAGQATFFYRSKGTAIATATTNPVFPGPTTRVLTGYSNITAPIVALRIDGVQVASNVTTQGTGTYLDSPIFIGGRQGGTQLYTGHIHQLIVRAAPTDVPTMELVEQYVAKKAGIEL